MRVRNLVLSRIVVASIVASAGAATAAPRYSEALDEATLSRAKAELRTLAKREGVEDATADLLLKLDVFATSNDTGCPGVDVDVVNATSRVVWNIEIKIEQKDDLKNRKDTLHLPYMLPNTQVRATVSCLQDYSYRSRYDYSKSNGISLTYSAEGGKTLDEALPLMLEQHVDYTRVALGISPTTVADGRNLLEEALAMDDEAVAKELVLGIARTGVGKKELGEAIAANGTGAIADEVVNAMSKLPAAQQAQLARTLLASTVASRWKDKLMPMIDRQLCVGNRADVVGLWIQAQGTDGIPVEEFRTRISERCKPTKADGPGMLAALDKAPDHAGATLDAVDGDLFAGVVAGWRTSKASALPPGLVAYLRDGANEERFDAATAVVPAYQRTNAVLGVINAPEGPAAKHKAAWVTTTVDKVTDPDDLAFVVTSSTQALVTGEVRAMVLRDAVKALAAKSPKAAEDVLVTFAGKHSKIFDPEKLRAAGLDLGDFLAFDQGLGDCTATIQVLTACATKIAAYKDRSGEGALKKLAKTAAQPEFTKSVHELLATVHDPASLIDVSAALGTAGFDTGFIADRACREAEDSVRYDGDPSDALALAAKISPDAPCITAVHDAVTSKHRKAVLLGILGIVGFLAPFPVGWWFVRKRYRKLQQELPAEAAMEGPTGAKLEDRLGVRGLGRGLSGAIADANRELAGTPAHGSLGGVDEAVINAASSTVRRAVKSGDAATLLVRGGSREAPYRNAAGAAIYVVALPVATARPQTVQRYLGAPWPEHLASIQRAAGTPVLALVILCGPDAAEASLLVGFNDGTAISDPEALLDAREARERGANKFCAVMTLAATPAPTPPSTINPVTKAA